MAPRIVVFLCLLYLSLLFLWYSWFYAFIQADVIRYKNWSLMIVLLVPVYVGLCRGALQDSRCRTYLKHQKTWELLLHHGAFLFWVPYLLLVVIPNFYFGASPESAKRPPARKALLTLLWLPLFLIPPGLIFFSGERDVPIGSRAEYIAVMDAQFRTEAAIDLYRREKGASYMPKELVAIFDDPSMPEKYPKEYEYIQAIPAGLVVRVKGVIGCVGCWFDDAVYYAVVAEGLDLEREDLEMRICCGTQLGKSFNNQWFIEIHKDGAIELNPKYLTPAQDNAAAPGGSL